MRRITKAGIVIAGLSLVITGIIAGPHFYARGGSSPSRSAAAAAKLARADANIAFLHQRVVRQPDDTEGLRSLAHEWIARGKLSGDGADFVQARHILDQAEVEEPGSLRLLGERIRMLEAGHRFVSARQLAESGLARDPDDNELLGLAGDSSLYSGDYTAAEHYYRRFTEVAPKSPSAFIGLSFWAELSGDLEQAVTLVEKAPTVSYPTPLSHEREAYVHAVLGEIRSKQGEVAEARKEFETALQIIPDYSLAASGLSDLEQWQGHDAQAEALLRGLVERESPNADYEVKLADLRERHGDKSEAKQLRADAEKFYAWSIASGDNGYLRPLATLKLAEGDYRTAAELAARDLPERPSAESRTIYRNILRQAQSAGVQLDENSLRNAAAGTLHLAANP